METSDVLIILPKSSAAGDLVTTDTLVVLQSIYENGVEQAELQAYQLGVLMMVFILLALHLVRQWGR